MSIEPNRRFQARPVVSCGDEEDGAVLYNPDTDATSVVNPSGRALWFFLETPRTKGEIIEHLLQTYSNVTVEQANEDVEIFLENLIPDFLQDMNDAG